LEEDGPYYLIGHDTATQLSAGAPHVTVKVLGYPDERLVSRSAVIEGFGGDEFDQLTPR
jgi:hypothetical protein